MAFSHPWARESGGCPTSKLTILRLHVAGPYRNDKNLMDIYISSYAPSLASHADASGIANMISFASRGSSPAECRSKTTRTARGRARSPQDSELRRACSPDVLFENCHGRYGYYRRELLCISSTIVGSTSLAMGAQNATRSHSSHSSR